MEKKKPVIIDVSGFQKKQTTVNNMVLYTVLGVFTAIIVFVGLSRVITDYLWFEALTYESVFLTILFSRIGIVLLTAIVAFILLSTNVSVALQSRKALKKVERRIISGSIAGFSLLVGLFYQTAYFKVLRYIHRVDFNVVDPLFAKDIGFYVFSLPFFFLITIIFDLLAHS